MLFAVLIKAGGDVTPSQLSSFFRIVHSLLHRVQKITLSPAPPPPPPLPARNTARCGPAAGTPDVRSRMSTPSCVVVNSESDGIYLPIGRW